MSTLEKRFEWYLERKADLEKLTRFVRDIERKLPSRIFDWAVSTARDSVMTLRKEVDGVDFEDIEIEKDDWATWWFKRSQYSNKGRGAYLHLFVPDGIDWLKEESENTSYIGFVLNYGDSTDTVAKFIESKIAGLPDHSVPERNLDDDGSLQIYRYNLRHILTASNLAKSEQAAREFDHAIKQFTIPLLQAVSIVPPQFTSG